MAFKGKATATDFTKMYFWKVSEDGAGMATWRYVSADSVVTVSGSGYIADAFFIAMLKGREGDMVQIYQVGSIADTRSIRADMRSGITDIGLCTILDATASLVEMSDDLLGATVTYGS